MSEFLSVAGHPRVQAFRRVLQAACEGADGTNDLAVREERLLDALAYLVNATKSVVGQEKAVVYLKQLQRRLVEHTMNMPDLLMEAVKYAEKNQS